jgi:hypothetical protein
MSQRYRHYIRPASPPPLARVTNNILKEVIVDTTTRLPRCAIIRAPRTVTTFDGDTLSYALMQHVLLELVVSTVQSLQPRWSREHILNHVTGNVFFFYFRFFDNAPC